MIKKKEKKKKELLFDKSFSIKKKKVKNLNSIKSSVFFTKKLKKRYKISFLFNKVLIMKIALNIKCIFD